MKSIRNFKKIFITMLCAVAMLCTGLFALNLDRENSINAAANETNKIVTYADANSFGQYTNGHIYQFTDKNKIDGFRNGSLDSDTTQVVVDTTQAHGSQQNPYVIATYDDWEKLVKFCGTTGGTANQYYILANDIDFNGKDFHPVAVFAGNFYGNGKTLLNITCSSWQYWNGSAYAQLSSQTAAGFGIFCDVGGTISDLNVLDYNFTGFPEVRNSNFRNFGLFAGAIAGISNFGEPYILNCSTYGEFYDSITYTNNHNYRTGIIGAVNRNLTVYRCSADVKLESKSTGVPCVGAIVGVAPAGSGTVRIYDCVGNVNANITLSNSNNCYHAGIPCIWTSLNTIMDNIIGTINVNTALHNAGGVLGFENGANYITASNCYLKGTETYSNGSKTNMYAVHSDSVAPNSSMFTNVNVVKDQSAFQNMYGSIQRPYAGNNQLSSDNDLIAKAKTDLVNSPVFDIDKIENFGSFDIENNPVRNNIHIIIPKHFDVGYNGQAFKLENYINVPQQYYTVNYDDSQNYTDAGIHTFTINLSSDAHNASVYIEETDALTATIDVEITKAPLSFSQLQVDEFGKLIGIGSSQTVSDFLTNTLSSGTVYTRDIGQSTAPEFVLQYKKLTGSWSETLPTTAGDWYVRAYIKNSTTSNYYLENDGQTAFTRAKDYVAMPYFYNLSIDPTQDIVGETTTVKYQGTSQIFSLFNNLEHNALTGISIGPRSTGLSYSTSTGNFSVTGVGAYTVEVSLADPTNTQWSDKTSGSKTITLNVQPAELIVTIDEASKTSWSKGERNFKILIYVDGIIDNDAVKIDASYGIVGKTDVQYVPENNMVIDTTTHRMTITVDTTNLSINQKYFLDIALKDDVAVNKNYVLVNQTGNWEFMLTSSKIKKEDITEVWMYTNIIAGSADFASTTSGTVDYNESEYTIKLNPAFLPAGVDIAYSGVTTATNSNNSRVNTITAVLSPKDGYAFENDVQTTYTFNWTITPIECDLSSLIWTQDFEYNGKTQTMILLNLPSWLSADNYSGNTGRNANTYTAEYIAYLTQYGNHTFTNRAGSSEVVIAADGRSATITHNWEIKKAKIQVSNSADLWLVDPIRNIAGDMIDVRVPIAMATYGSQLILKYYTDSACTTEIDPMDMVLVKEEGSDKTTPTPYYAKVELDPNFADNYELENVSQSGATSAVLRFNVGGRRAIIHLTVDTELVYNGQTQTVSITSDDGDYNALVGAGKANYIVKYYAVLDDAGNYGTDEVDPKYVGRYVAVIFVNDLDNTDSDDIVNEYIVYCHTHYFEITQLKLTTNWSYTANANTAIPAENVIANRADINVTDFYDYTIYDGTGTNIVGTKASFSLGYNTKYIARLSIKDTSTNGSGLANVVIVDAKDNVTFTNVTEFAFTTGQNPDAPAVVLDNPEIVGATNIVFDKNSHNIVIQIRDNVTNTYVTDISQYVTVTLKGSTSSVGSDIFEQTNAGTYTFEITIKDSLNASWLWDDGNATKEVTFTIEKKPIIAPNTKTEYTWTGDSINIWTDDTSWLAWVDNSVLGTYSATELGSNLAKFVLIDKDNTYWDNRTLIDAGTETDDIEFNWEIVKVKITGEWKENDKGYPEFVVDNQDLNDGYFTIKYLDSKGDEVKPENFTEGQKYKATVTVTDTTHFEFIGEDNKAYTELQLEFEYQKPLGFFEKAWDFIKANWLWFVIGLVCLLVLILLIIIIAVVKKRKKKKVQEEAKKTESEENEKLKAELEKAKYEKELAELKAQQQQQFNGFANPQSYGQMPMGYMGQMQQPMQAGYSIPNPDGTEKDKKQDEQISELRQMVEKLAKYNTATTEEKNQSKKLASTEDMLKEFLLIEFANNPDWIPFDSEDMIDYDVKELLAIYKLAKKRQSKLSKQGGAVEQQAFKAESKSFETNYNRYNTIKKDSGYEELLREVRALRAENKQLVNRIEESEKKQAEREFNSAKQDIAKNREIIEKNKADIEALKNETQLEAVTKVANNVSIQKLEFDEAFEKLPSIQRNFFSELKSYALKQPQARIKNTKYNLAIGVGQTNYIKFGIKYNTLIASFGTSEMKIEDEKSVEKAKKLIDEAVKDFLIKK